LNGHAADVERCALSVEDADKLARACRDSPDPFSFEEIPPSLLSAEHIEKYVLKTGLIAPFFLGGDRKSRLKKASYEGRIGSKAYVFDDKNELKPVLIPDKPLVIPANSIVFVESDLDFRLPRYIALRFNLQIRHVHRGLLLGTGPLVDPGFWGKLCIPLHNLTNEDYEIPLDEGLIWIEFTKTTSDSREGRITLAEGEEHSEHWEIEKFLRKAATPLVKDRPNIGIRSSIPTMVARATGIAEEARDVSQKALEASEAAKNNASSAEQEASKTRALFNRIGWLGALVAAVAILTLWATFVAGIVAFYLGVDSRVDALGDRVKELSSTVERSTREQLDGIRSQIHELQAVVESLRSQEEAGSDNTEVPPLVEPPPSQDAR
jgi:deoxycytidine triphosphate deaminase